MRGLLPSADAKTIADAIASLAAETFDALAPIERIALGAQRLLITFSQAKLAERLEVTFDQINPDHLSFDAPFVIRRRGVETRLVLDDEALPRDATLIANIARGQAFLAQITLGGSFREIADQNALSVKRVQQIIEFAFLSPEVVGRVIEGRQPSFLTADWCLKHDIPVDWVEQQALFRTA